MTKGRRVIELAVALLLLGGVLRAADELPQAEPALRCTWTEPDHPSGIYYAKANGTLQVIVENNSGQPLELAGSIAFGAAVATPADFKPLSLTPITPTTLAPRERAKLPLAVTFAAAGPYELRWVRADKSFTAIENGSGVGLQAIFALPSAAAGTTAIGSRRCPGRRHWFRDIFPTSPPRRPSANSCSMSISPLIP